MRSVVVVNAYVVVQITNLGEFGAATCVLANQKLMSPVRLPVHPLDFVVLSKVLQRVDGFALELRHLRGQEVLVAIVLRIRFFSFLCICLCLCDDLFLRYCLFWQSRSLCSCCDLLWLGQLDGPGQTGLQLLQKMLRSEKMQELNFTRASLATFSICQEF